MLAELPAQAIFAHRGASAYAPENTLAAFQLALRQDADGIELDAKLTADGHVVVIHDQSVDRTTMHTGRVRELTLAEIRQMDAGSHFDVAFRGEPVPTLEEVFKAVGQLTFINVELTNYASLTDALPEKVAELVKRFKLNRRVLFSSFNPLALVRIRRLLPEAPIGLLALPGTNGSLARSWPGRLLAYQSLHPEKGDVTSALVARTHQRGNKIFVYTVNLEDDMQRLFAQGVDGIFTDDPVLACQVRSKLPAS
ncbi:MAG: glycerophosphodiester phosphodiesterase family protein [Chloroflexota bacterium]